MPRCAESAAELFAQLKSETRPRDLVRACRAASDRRSPSRAPCLPTPRVVLMDEPTAAISVRQVAEVLELIRRLRDRGISVVLISHRMPDVFAVCDRIAVLRRGMLVADVAAAETSPEQITGLITGAIETRLRELGMTSSLEISNRSKPAQLDAFAGCGASSLLGFPCSRARLSCADASDGHFCDRTQPLQCGSQFCLRRHHGCRDDDSHRLGRYRSFGRLLCRAGSGRDRRFHGGGIQLLALAGGRAWCALAVGS